MFGKNSIAPAAAGVMLFLFSCGAVFAGAVDPRNELQLYTAAGDYGGELYYPAGSTGAYIRSQSALISRGESKKIIRNRADTNWEILLQYIPFPSKEKAYAFLEGHATLESTLNPALETAYTPGWCQNSAHAFGLIQTAETAFFSSCAGWMPEYVPDFPQAPLTEGYFTDPVSSFDMGLRKLCWFALKAREEMRAKKPGFAQADDADFRCAPDFWMLMLKGFNTGWATYDVYEGGEWKINQGWVDFYGTWVPATAQFYYYGGHVYDAEWTWHTDPRSQVYTGNLYEWLCQNPDTPTATSTSSIVPTSSVSPVNTATATATMTASRVQSPTSSVTATATGTRTPTSTVSSTVYIVSSATNPPTLSASPTATVSATRTTLPASPSFTCTRTTVPATRTPSASASPTSTASRVSSIEPTPTLSLTSTLTLSESPTATGTRSPTVTVSSIASTATATATPTCTLTPYTVQPTPVFGPVLVYPNPYSLSSGGIGVRFKNLNCEARASIYTVSGEFVETVPCVQGRAVWDLRNTSGMKVSPGLYMYVIRDPGGGSVAGKILVKN